MGQLNFVKLSKPWVAFSELVETLEENTQYVIQNRGNDILVALEAATTPQGDNQAGILIYPGDMAVYKKGEQNLYLRAFNLECSINITKGE